MIPWEYEGQAISTFPEGAKAFVYYLEFGCGKRYIGKKNLHSTTRQKVPGKTRRKIIVKESNWRQYLSSSELVKTKLKAGDKLVKREILRWCYSLTEATYWETKLQFDHNVLCNPLYLNGLIYCKILRCVENVDM